MREVNCPFEERLQLETTMASTATTVSKSGHHPGSPATHFPPVSEEEGALAHVAATAYSWKRELPSCGSLLQGKSWPPLKPKTAKTAYTERVCRTLCKLWESIFT